MSAKDSARARPRGEEVANGNGKDGTPTWTDADEGALRAWVRERGLEERRATSTRHLFSEVPVALPDWEVAAERQRRQEQKRWRAEALADRQRRPEWYMTIAQVPEDFRAKTWNDFRPLPGKAQALKAVRHLAEGNRTKPGLMLFGGVGGGKSLLAALHLKQRLLNGIALDVDWRRVADGSRWPPPLLWQNVGGLLRRVRARCFDAADSTEESELGALSRAEVLVLDDLGIKGLSEWAEEFLLAVIDDRWSRKREILITTNYESGGLVQIVGERIASRILGLCESIKVGGEDMRRMSR